MIFRKERFSNFLFSALWRWIFQLIQEFLKYLSILSFIMNAKLFFLWSFCEFYHRGLVSSRMSALQIERDPLRMNSSSSCKSALLLITTYKSAFDPDKKGDPAPPLPGWPCRRWTCFNSHSVWVWLSCPQYNMCLAWKSETLFEVCRTLKG